MTTSPDGTYEALLPSTETFNCPIPQGPCPGMYLVKVDDPGTKAHPNASYDPNLLTATTPADVWPGLTDQLDTAARPDLRYRLRGPGRPGAARAAAGRPPVVRRDRAAGGSPSRRDFIGAAGTATGATGGRATLTDDRTGAGHDPDPGQRRHRQLDTGRHADSDVPDRIVINVPAVTPRTFPPGPKQLTITTANANGGGVQRQRHHLHVSGNGTGATPSPTTRRSSTSAAPTRTERTSCRPPSTAPPPAACWSCRPASTTRTSWSGSR